MPIFRHEPKASNDPVVQIEQPKDSTVTPESLGAIPVQSGLTPSPYGGLEENTSPKLASWLYGGLEENAPNNGLDPEQPPSSVWSLN